MAKDFIGYIMSAEGQAIVNENSFISVVEGNDYTSTKEAGEITIGGSTSVYPLMEKLAESYQLINPNGVIKIEGIGSSAGLKGAVEGTFDIGMASRELKDTEKAELVGLAIALDGIAVIIHNENETDTMTVEQVKDVYTDTITSFEQLK